MGTFSVGSHHPWVFFLWFLFILPGTVIVLFSHYCAAFIFGFVILMLSALFAEFAESPMSRGGHGSDSYIGRSLLAVLSALISLTLILLFAFLGPGTVFAYVEKPFNVGPLTTHGKYCTTARNFESDVYESQKSQSIELQKRFAHDFVKAYRNSPDSKSRSVFRAIGVAIEQRDNSAYQVAIQNLENYLDSSCGGWFKWTYNANSVYHGILGPQFG